MYQLLLKKIIYTEHPLAKKLQDVSVLTYIPEWNNNIESTKIIPKKKEKENITEELKSSNQMLWISKMNNIKNIADEIALKEYIYV